MTDVEQRLSELRQLWTESTDPHTREEIEIEADLLKCCISISGTRCGKPVATMKSVVCEIHKEKRAVSYERKQKLSVSEMQERLKQFGQESSGRLFD